MRDITYRGSSAKTSQHEILTRVLARFGQIFSMKTQILSKHLAVAHQSPRELTLLG
jgi:hypothetical protein